MTTLHVGRTYANTAERFEHTNFTDEVSFEGTRVYLPLVIMYVQLQLQKYRLKTLMSTLSIYTSTV